MKKYTKFIKYNNWEKWNNNYNWKQGCELCKKSFEEKEKFVRIDIETNQFRGDDDVYCFHKKCYGDGLKKLNLI